MMRRALGFTLTGAYHSRRLGGRPRPGVEPRHLGAFDRAADLFGTAGRVIDYPVLGTTTIAVVRIAGIVVGHLVAAVSAHNRAVRLFPAHAARAVQYPLLAAMVTLTMGAVGLMLAA